MSQKYSRKIFSELHTVLDVFRTIFRDNKRICASIDDSYEEALVMELQMVPEQFDEMILKYLKFVKVIANNVNFKKLALELEALNDDSIPHIELNSMNEVKEGLSKLNLDRKDRAKIMNMIQKFAPIFKCVDHVVSMPIEVLKRIGELTDKSYCDIL